MLGIVLGTRDPTENKKGNTFEVYSSAREVEWGGKRQCRNK